MSHLGNDEIIDNKRDNPKYVLIEKSIFIATEIGFEVVQELAAETLKRKPGLSLKEFTKIMDQYLEKQKDIQKS
tara:strand:+ start:426 stop:647 length:222 start_codon:yes stop_codon:yes gene_type:complete